jgi:hypothetical protein
MNEIIYILINESMPGYVKIGRTTDLEQRMRSLDTTSVPLPFECYYACTVSNAAYVEKQLHDAFMDHRIRSSREFFEISPDRVASALKLAEIENITPQRDYVETAEDQQALNQARQRRAVFSFNMTNIPVGAEISYVNDENIKARVVDNKHIEFNGEVTSLSASAQKLLGYPYQVQGTIYWIYEGETLDERRRRLESEE